MLKKTPKLGLVVLVVGLSWAAAQTAVATPPPISIALAAVGEQAPDRREVSWQMTRVDDGVTELCALPIDSEQDQVRFGAGVDPFFVSAESDSPWHLLWAMMWSTNPAEVLSRFVDDWGDSTARFELVDDQPAQCYGQRSRICVDLEARRIVTLEVTVDGTAWRLRSARQGESLQISADGRQIARLRRGECF